MHHLLENLGRLLVTREAPLSRFVLLSPSSSLDSSDLHLDTPLLPAASATEDFLFTLQLKQSWLAVNQPY
jgi:hypothetical protein